MKLFSFEDWVEYTPEALDNRDSPEPMTLEIKPMSAAEQQRHRLVEGPKLADKANGIRNAERLVSKMLKERVRNIAGLAMEVHGADGVKVVEITDPAQFDECAPEELRVDIFRAILDGNKLAEGVKKK